MKNKELLQKLQQSGGYIANTHIEMTGLDHSDTYLNKDLLLSDPISLKVISEAIVDLINDDIEVVCGPPFGGLMLAEAVALTGLGTQKKLKMALTEKNNSEIRLKRGQAKLIKGKGVLIVDDVVKSGQTLGQTITAVNNAGGKLTQIIVLANWRGADLMSIGRIMNIVELLPSPSIYQADNCELCVQNITIDLPNN